MGELSQHTIAKVSGPAWESLRGQFLQIARLLLAVSRDADSELMTSYVKFTINTAPQSPVFAAIWLKSSKRLIVGLALPEECEAEELGPACLGQPTRASRNTSSWNAVAQSPRALQNGRGSHIRTPCQCQAFKLPREKNFDGWHEQPTCACPLASIAVCDAMGLRIAAVGEMARLPPYAAFYPTLISRLTFFSSVSASS